VGRLIDRYPLKRIFFVVILAQAPLFALAAVSSGWALLLLQLGFMVFVFGAVPFNDAIMVRYVDDHMRSRISGMRLAISFGFSSLAIWALGPVVKAAGFETLLFAMALIALLTLAVVSLLPGEQRRVATAA
jgi:predicted MFS family arabinose efflux permease